MNLQPANHSTGLIKYSIVALDYMHFYNASVRRKQMIWILSMFSMILEKSKLCFLSGLDDYLCLIG